MTRHIPKDEPPAVDYEFTLVSHPHLYPQPKRPWRRDMIVAALLLAALALAWAFVAHVADRTVIEAAVADERRGW